MQKVLLLSFFAIIFFASKAAKIDTVMVISNTMKKDVQTVIIVPNKASNDKCPVVYLLHGYGNNAKTWIEIKPELPRIADEKGIIFVCPDGKNSWYWDSPKNKDVRYETFISKELVSYVDSHYNTIADRKGRAITGLSMGGHGAMWNAIRHTDVFSAAGTTSGGMDIRPFPKNWEMSIQLGELSENKEIWDYHTVINLVPTMKPGRLAIIMDCGERDFFLEVNKNLHEAFLKKGIEHDFIIRPGEHNFKYWNNSIDYQILFFDKYFKSKE